MRALVLIAVASIATQLPARDTSHGPVGDSDRRAEESCSGRDHNQPMVVGDGRTFRPLSFSQSVI